MGKIIMLGTGHGGTLEIYNTCFVLQNEQGNFLIDTGGSIEIIKRLKEVKINLTDIKHIFISHSHTDHILGLIWMLKKLSIIAIKGEIKDKIHIYCNDVVYEAIRGISKYTLPEKFYNAIMNVIEFHILSDGEHAEINGIDYTFFDILARGTKQFGFECLMNEKRLLFLGDETLNSNLYDRVRDADYAMHEAFCLDSEENIFHAYEKNHSTVKSACNVMNGLGVKNLILYHTEESHGKDRKALYTKEGTDNFKGNIYVPDQLETIEI